LAAPFATRLLQRFCLADPGAELLRRWCRVAWRLTQCHTDLKDEFYKRVKIPALVRAVSQLTLEKQQLRDMHAGTGGGVVPFPGRVRPAPSTDGQAGGHAMRLPPPHAAFSRVSTTGPGTFLTLDGKRVAGGYHS
jgi:hypothetical protein